MATYITSYETQVINPNNIDTGILALKNTSEIVGNIISCDTSLQQIVAARFKILKSNGSTIFSPILPYDGTYPISYSFGLARSDFLYNVSSPSDDSIIVTQEVQVVNGNWWNDSLWTILRYRDYERPSASLIARRNDIDNTHADFAITAEAHSIVDFYSSEINSLSYKMQCLIEGIWVDRTTLVTVPSFVFSDIVSDVLPYSAEQTYRTRVVVKDLLYEVYAYDTLPTSSIVMTWGRDGAGFGKIWEHGALDVFGDYWKNGILQPTLYKKKLSDPDPEGMEDGDLLFIYNDQTPFSSTNFPQEFGTGITWGQTGSWPIEYNYWTSMSATSNSIIKSFQTSAFTGNSYPSAMFNGNTAWNDGVMMPYGSLPVTMIIEFNGSVQFDSFTIWGWAQGHEIKNSPKSFAFFGSNDGHTWISLFDTTTFADSYNTSVSANMSNTGLYFKYLKMVWRTNQDDNSGNLTNASMIAFRELSFVASGSMYV